MFLYTYGGKAWATNNTCATSDEIPFTIPFTLNLINLGPQNHEATNPFFKTLERMVNISGGERLDGWSKTPTLKHRRKEKPGKINKNKEIKVWTCLYYKPMPRRTLVCGCAPAKYCTCINYHDTAKYIVLLY